MATESVHEEWKPVVGYEGFYEVSSLGRVRSTSVSRGRVLRPHRTGKGYHGVSLWHQNRAKHAKIAHLVAAAFIGPRPSGYQVNHIDGNKVNNRVANLEYVTGQENCRHAREVLGFDNRGEKMGWSKLTVRDVLEIRRRLASGESRRLIVKDFPVTARHVYDIGKRRTWKHVA